jgi:hypothetical protein
MSVKRSTLPREATREHGATPATIVALEGGDRVAVRVSTDDHTRAASARVASIAGYEPSEGDRVLVSGRGDELYVIGVLRASVPVATPDPASPPTLRGRMALPDGGSVEVREGAMELRDPSGHLLVRYADGAAEIAAPAGDLILSAPSGRVVLRSGLDVSIEATRDVVQRGGRVVALSAGASTEDATPQLKIEARDVSVTSERVLTEAKESRFVGGEVTTVARAMKTTVASFALSTEKYELSATKLVEVTRDAFRDVADLAQSRIGRVRMLVREVYSQRARRTVIASTEDTSVDGRKVLLG